MSSTTPLQFPEEKETTSSMLLLRRSRGRKGRSKNSTMPAMMLQIEQLEELHRQHQDKNIWPKFKDVDYTCKGWRKTLQCDPGGVRDIMGDRDCKSIIKEGESGWCECGTVTTTPGTGCTHEPFTCEEICYKLAAIAGDPDVADKLKKLREKLGPHQLDDFKRAVTPPPFKKDTLEQVKKLMEGAEKQVKVVEEKAIKATDGIQKAMSEMERSRIEAEQRIAYARNPDGKPLWKALQDAGDAAVLAGQKAEATANSMGFHWDKPIDYPRKDIVESWTPPLPPEIINPFTAGGRSLP